jgi:hypothetical protein
MLILKAAPELLQFSTQMTPVESVWRDLRTVIRVLGKSPGATALSTLSIALGIGLTAGIFSVGDAMLLRPMPFHEPGSSCRLPR